MEINTISGWTYGLALSSKQAWYVRLWGVIVLPWQLVRFVVKGEARFLEEKL